MLGASLYSPYMMKTLGNPGYTGYGALAGDFGYGNGLTGYDDGYSALVRPSFNGSPALAAALNASVMAPPGVGVVPYQSMIAASPMPSVVMNGRAMQPPLSLALSQREQMAAPSYYPDAYPLYAQQSQLAHMTPQMNARGLHTQYSHMYNNQMGMPERLSHTYNNSMAAYPESPYVEQQVMQYAVPRFEVEQHTVQVPKTVMVPQVTMETQTYQTQRPVYETKYHNVRVPQMTYTDVPVPYTEQAMEMRQEVVTVPRAYGSMAQDLILPQTQMVVPQSRVMGPQMIANASLYPSAYGAQYNADPLYSRGAYAPTSRFPATARASYSRGQRLVSVAPAQAYVGASKQFTTSREFLRGL